MRIEWLGPVQFTSDDLVRPITGAKAPGPDPEQLQTAQELILAMLTDGQRPANEVSQAAKLQGISYRTLSRAAARLGVKRSKPEFDGPWFWRLPSVPWGSQNGTGPDDEEHGS